MVKEKKKLNTLDLIGRYSLLSSVHYQDRIAAFLNELSELFETKWIYVENHLDNKQYTSKDFTLSTIELNSYYHFSIEAWGKLYLERLDENLETQIAEIAELVKLVINNIEEQERNNIIFLES